MLRKLLISLPLLLILFLSIKGSLADDAGLNETSITINVSVESVTQIRINPTSVNWTTINPGSTGGVREIDVINIGSTNVTGIYGYVDTIADESMNPIGNSSAQAYAAGGVLTLRRNETGTLHYFAGRLDWNYTRTADAIQLITLPTGAVSWGWARNASYEYVWAVVNGTPMNATDGFGCNETGTVIRMNKYDDVGNTTTRDVNSVSTSYPGGWQGSTPDWGLFSFEEGPWAGYCVAVFRNCTKIYSYKFDKRNTGGTNFAQCNNTQYFNTTTFIGPNEVQTINLDSWVPYGTPAGDLLQGTLTIYATTQLTG